MSDFAAELNRLRTESGLSLRDLGARAHYSDSYLHDVERGRKAPTTEVARRLDDALAADGRLAATLRTAVDEDVELVRRVTASDVSRETLDRLELAADRLCMAYATVSPALLLPRVRRHLDYVTSLVGARKTLTQHRRLIVVGGWLALLRATLHIDLRQSVAADAYLGTAARMAEEADHREIVAWAFETRAWDVLTGGDFRGALELSRQAQAVAPPSSSAFIQATAQEGRAWARLGGHGRQICPTRSKSCGSTRGWRLRRRRRCGRRRCGRWRGRG